MKALSILIVLFLGCSTVDQPEIELSGKLVGHDGNPMKVAHVHLIEANSSKPQKSVAVGIDGSFHITGSGGWITYIEFTGVDHSSQRYFVLTEKPVKLDLDVRLSSYPYRSELTDVSIIGGFNDFNVSTAKMMLKQEDGTYIAEFETTADKFKYQLVGLTRTMQSVNGTQSEDFEYDNAGDYRSIVTPKNGKAKIVFDPKKLVQSDSEPSLTVRNDPLMSKFFSLQIDMNKRQAASRVAGEAHMRSGKDMKTFSYDWSHDIAQLSSEISTEKEPLLRKMLLASYLSVPVTDTISFDKNVAKLALDEIEFSSPLWSVNPMALYIAVRGAGVYDHYDSYLKKFFQQHPDKDIKANLLLGEVMKAKFRNDTEQLSKYYDILMNEYSDTRVAQIAKARLSPNSKLATNKPVPVFAAASMEDSRQVYTKESFKGKYYLIDFWAVWCSPCIAEMENLHKAYERYKDKNFQILSLSFDAKPEDVVKFRKGKWNMPWLHSLVEGGFKSQLAKEFEVIGIPKPILVDPAGNIVAIGNDLRGQNLEKTLSRFLGGGE